MERKLSFEKIDSYAGDVLPLRLLGEEDFTKEEITWKTDDPCVQIRSFAGKAEASFTNGILLTLLYPGKANVTAVFEGKEYTCPVTVHECETHSSEEEFNYYIGDFHDHTTNIHNRAELSQRGPELYPAEYIKKYAGRCPVVHLKDFYGEKSEDMYELIGIDKKAPARPSGFEFRPVGSGIQNFPAIIESAIASGAEWVVVEQDKPSMGLTPMECAKKSIEYVKSIL